ncbi:hypothetical protein [Halodesulfurarchaeum sp.]|uniref:hypothetical protein n=1 Tax=Halodesulfurarchaeum sp. TaxID=1980530 RepID=UPI001BBC26EF|nr:hypothetical protein [Halodesulfurarchaeum sp.]
MAETTEKTNPALLGEGYRAAISMIVALVVTFAVFIGVTGWHPVVTAWIPTAVGLVGLEVGYTTYNELWLWVRLLLGAYITAVLLIVSLQLIGTWRRLIADAGGES